MFLTKAANYPPWIGTYLTNHSLVCLINSSPIDQMPENTITKWKSRNHVRSRIQETFLAASAWRGLVVCGVFRKDEFIKGIVASQVEYISYLFSSLIIHFIIIDISQFRNTNSKVRAMLANKLSTLYSPGIVSTWWIQVRKYIKPLNCPNNSTYPSSSEIMHSFSKSDNLCWTRRLW